MAITSRDARGNTVLLNDERMKLREAFLKFKKLLGKKGDVQLHPQMVQILAHSWDILRFDHEAPLSFYQKGILGSKKNLSASPTQFVRHQDGATIVSDKDRACLRAFIATALSALSRERIEIPADAQRALSEGWDVVREPSDPALALEKKSSIWLPFGEGLSPKIAASRGFSR